MKLSEFKDERAIEVVADLLEPITNIVKNPENAAAKGKSKLEFTQAILKNNAHDVMKMLAILNDKKPDEYHCNAATVFVDVMQMLADPELAELFGVQGMTATSACSASTNSEVTA